MKLTEKQKLHKRLNAFRSMIGDGIKDLDSALVERINDTIRRLGSNSKVAIAGLSDSQHTSLAEFLVGEALFHNDDERQKCPTIQVRYGKEAKTHAIFGETRKTYPGLALSVALGGKVPDVIGLEVTNPVAAEIGFTILPAYQGDDSRGGYLINLLDDTESIIWCSSATTPWQPRERRLWFTVPDPLKERSILALTGAENVSDDAARTALNEKRAFVADEFYHHTPIFVDAAKGAYVKGKVTDEAQFASSGGETLFNQITGLVQAKQSVLLEEARALRTELDKIPLGGAEPAPVVPLSEAAPTVTAEPATPVVATPPSATTPAAEEEVVEEVVQETASPVDQLEALVLQHANLCKAGIAECTKTDYAPIFEPMTDLLSGIQKAIRGDLKLSRDHSTMVTQVEEASELVGLLSYENNEKAAQEAADVTRQIVTDIWSRLPNSAADTEPTTTEIEKFSAAS